MSSRKEVILSAGSLHTPQLLELSGIGDEARLTALGIPVVIANSDVGENLQVWYPPPVVAPLIYRTKTGSSNIEFRIFAQ